ncbi:MAG TPA: 4'-phosphopantetheinyl transferase superfamily protein [Chitinophagaceae bacterium]|nr:4'-phosphopantetheinyl transferase superfamily protein [Chitinophagaceae bacterium]
MSLPISIYYCQLSGTDDPEIFGRLLHALPVQSKSSIVKYAAEQDRRLRIAGKALLRYGLQQLDPSDKNPLDQYRHTEGGKPLLQDSDIQFSISHSGNVAVCAITKGIPLGVDVEQVLPLQADLLQPYFNKEQWQNILQATDVLYELYRQWTIKEAALKAWGIAIGEAELKEIHIEDDTVRYGGHSLPYHMTELVAGYTACIAGAHNQDKINFLHIALAALQ